MDLKLGFLLPTRERIMVGTHETTEILELADYAESIGLDSVWIGDSLLAKPRHEPLSLIAAIAGRTKKIELGTGVLLPMLRNPVVLAHQVATIDQISEGRIILGIGTARDVPTIRNEFEAAGIPFEKRIGTMLEQVKLCRALWSGEKVNWNGRWNVKDAELAPKPFSKGGPRIWGGGGVPAALKRSARYFDGWFPSGPGNGENWHKSWQQLNDYAKEAGRQKSDIIGAAYVTVAINNNVPDAEKELDEYLANYYLRPAELVRNEQYSFAGDKAMVTAWLNEFIEAGASHLCIRFTGDNNKSLMDELAGMREQF
tara:strand:+ start:2285 stop:3223 length:939 start_codon:yes stop_codon:yes gene_type:complete